MTDRIKTTLRLPESLHKRFDEGNMNADIVARLEASFKDEWKDRHMSANELIESVEMPAVLRVKGSGNAHDDMSRLCELVTSMPVEMVVLAMDKQKASSGGFAASYCYLGGGSALFYVEFDRSCRGYE